MSPHSRSTDILSKQSGLLSRAFGFFKVVSAYTRFESATEEMPPKRSSQTTVSFFFLLFFFFRFFLHFLSPFFLWLLVAGPFLAHSDTSQESRQVKIRMQNLLLPFSLFFGSGSLAHYARQVSQRCWMARLDWAATLECRLV